MGDFQSMAEQALAFYLLVLAFWVAVIYGLLRLFNLHPLTYLAALLGL